MINTPGVGGYLIAWLVSVFALAVLLAAGALLLTGGDAQAAAGMAFLVIVFGGPVSVPFACAGMLLVHFACRRVTAQETHVVAAGLVGFAPLVAFMLVDGAELAPVLGVVPIATMIGRASVVPLVNSRRRTPAASPSFEPWATR